MRRNTPLLTLPAGASLGVVLLVASMMATPSSRSPYAVAAGLLWLSGPAQGRLTGSYRGHWAAGRARAGGGGGPHHGGDGDGG